MNIRVVFFALVFSLQCVSHIAEAMDATRPSEAQPQWKSSDSKKSLSPDEFFEAGLEAYDSGKARVSEARDLFFEALKGYQLQTNKTGRVPKRYAATQYYLGKVKQLLGEEGGEALLEQSSGRHFRQARTYLANLHNSLRKLKSAAFTEDPKDAKGRGRKGSHWEHPSKRGDPVAQLRIGNFQLKDGNVSSALAWYKRAAHLGLPNHLGPYRKHFGYLLSRVDLEETEFSIAEACAGAFGILATIGQDPNEAEKYLLRYRQLSPSVPISVSPLLKHFFPSLTEKYSKLEIVESKVPCTEPVGY